MACSADTLSSAGNKCFKTNVPASENASSSISQHVVSPAEENMSCLWDACGRSVANSQMLYVGSHPVTCCRTVGSRVRRAGS